MDMLGGPLELELIMARGLGDGLRDQPQGSPEPASHQAKEPNGYISPVYHCQTVNAAKLCIYDGCHKLKTCSDGSIGGTYSGQEPELWFFYTTSKCHGNNYLLNIFVNQRNPGSVTIQLSDSTELAQKQAVDDDVPHLVLPNNMSQPLSFKSTKSNQNHYIKTYCFNKDWKQFNPGSTLIIPIKIVTSPKFALDENIVKSIKLQHDLNTLMTKQEKTDFTLESSTHKQFPTHKIILAAHSPVLRNMIKNSELTSLFIDISDNDMELLLEFIYTGTIVDVMKHDCLKLLEIADKFQLRPLFTLTQQTIGDQITISNAVEVAVIAKKYHLEELQTKVFDFIIKNPEVMKTSAWMNLKDVELTKYLFQYMHTMRD